jgi:hypothetical protein
MCGGATADERGENPKKTARLREETRRLICFLLRRR